jgi:hypothetical protein
MDRMTFLKTLAGAGAVLPVLSISATAETGKCDKPTCMSDAAAVRQFLSGFLAQEEATLDRPALVKLMQQRGQACCRALQFRQGMIQQSQGSLDKMVELMGKIVGAENCRRSGDTVNLVYPVTKCVCGWSPSRPPTPDDPYCECSAANNQLLFQSVTEKKVTVKVLESPRRGGTNCRFLIHLA